jgi:hypothetical protein
MDLKSTSCFESFFISFTFIAKYFDRSDSTVDLKFRFK